MPWLLTLLDACGSRGLIQSMADGEKSKTWTVGISVPLDKRLSKPSGSGSDRARFGPGCKARSAIDRLIAPDHVHHPEAEKNDIFGFGNSWLRPRSSITAVNKYLACSLFVVFEGMRQTVRYSYGAHNAGRRWKKEDRGGCE